MEDEKALPTDSAANEFSAGVDAHVSLAIPGNIDRTIRSASSSSLSSSKRPSGELSVAFEGDVYVFPAATRDKVQAVLLLLGGRETSSKMHTSEFLLEQHNTALGGLSCGLNTSSRIASLVRFREKRKGRYFNKNIRHTSQEEVAQWCGQFVSVTDHSKLAAASWDNNGGTPPTTSGARCCQHCGVNEKSTPAMRRGPAGPRTLCNACGQTREH